MWFQENSARLSVPILLDEPLARHTYYRIGGAASFLAQPKSVEDLAVISEGLKKTGLPYFILGAGSNILVSDQGFAGLVIKMTRFDLSIEVTESELVRTGASVAISTLLRRAGTEGWKGFEIWTGIPGSVGGAVAMNAGTHLGEAHQIAEEVEAFSIESGTALRFSRDQLRFEYRKNLFLPKDAVVTAAKWKIQQADPASVQAVIQETLIRRKASQPIDFPSCGSVFKNPKEHGLHAWQVIDKIGLRGKRIGGAEFSQKHCNFITNVDQARAADVRALIDEAKARARDQLGIDLEEEVKYLGPF